MSKSILAMAVTAAMLAAPLGAQQQPALQLGPPTPAQAPTFDQMQQRAAQTPVRAPVASVPKATVPAAVEQPATVPPTGMVSAVAKAESKPKARRPTSSKKASAPADPYADLPINEPAREALRRSADWTGNNNAIVAGGADGRVVFVFGETMPTVVCAPMRMCEIELQAGEQVVDVPHVGDAVRWNVSPGITGSGENRQVHVIIKPGEAGLDTNLLIPTTRRMYRLRLVSSETNYVSVVSFSYPEDDRRAWDMAIAKQAVEEDKIVAELPAMSVDALDFNFGVTVKQGRPRWTPLRVFSDGMRTYIQLPEGTTQQDAPAVVALSRDGKEQLVNFRLRGTYVMVDQVLERAALISGLDGEGERIEIEHGCAKRTVFGNCKG
ncbi:P-type conjugative transfer protein TrbG [Xanthomonas campestris pv. campestris]|uniref:P-type conjugative transfer protein TrbG n=1 Tax=Xanthomonas campestris TaxID=339 RepID=UPI001E56871B|nr:P-type conjugative transfer protein TrbG [Xanthomonas campestris]MCD0253087.1 P-type conjugative transfer protein TrbG [Xanthomonas campestris pv. campestris]